jgi:hypothetical protein
MFAAAELAVDREGRLGFADATELCLLAEKFSERCLLHIVRILATEMPKANSLTSQQWAGVESTVQHLTDTWKDKNPEFLRFEMDRFWSAAMFVSYREVETVTGNPLEFVPAQWHRHVRAAAAWRLMELDSGVKRNLAEWTTLLEEALATRVSDTGLDRKESRRQGAKMAWAPDIIWIRDHKEDGKIPATFYLGRSRRPFSEDSLTDSTICILESAVRQKLDLKVLMGNAYAHPDPIVVWAATHLYVHGRKQVRRPAAGCVDARDCNPSHQRSGKERVDDWWNR